MAKNDVKLLGGWPSPFVNRVQIALNLKSVDYEFQEERIDNKSELLLKSNPVHKKVPVLIHDDKPICESLIIVQYVDEVWTSGPSILPSDPYDRATARFWAAYIDDKWFPPLRELRTTEGEEAKAELSKKLKEGLVLLEEAFIKCSKGKGFFGGERIGYLDIVFGSFLGWLKAVEKIAGLKLVGELVTPGLAAWAERFCSHEAVKGVIPETDRLVELAKIIQARLKAQSAPK
ncbi:glutathione S-transferase U17-like isoform X1 [Diospyros lotus]|uniref:glutathione S-transferase U17-like isoform X1 n=1 Tax=Diospyros lotus TaxID=55363 RepID=UPI00225579EC|nr:glutathione S-transferase U17-like isoform X1 [Diospyros lotus]